jgi:ABC-2 type transport system permease protein
MNSPNLIAANGRGWWMGFANLWRKENGTWWRTRRWWIQSLIWLVLLNGLLATVLWATWRQPAPAGEARATAGESASPAQIPEAFMDIIQDKATAGVFVFMLMSGIAMPIAAVIAGQDVIIAEKQSGTAAWVLSKPVSRPAFILAKLLAHGFAFLAVAIVVQGALAYLQVNLAAGELRLGIGFLGGLGLLYLNLMFYFCLALMLGTLFNSRGPVMGIPLALLLGYQLWLAIWPGLALAMPWALVLNILPGGVPLSVAVALGIPMPAYTAIPVVATTLWCLLFALVSIWRFQREEF